MKRPITLLDIERFLRITEWGPTRFGRLAIGDSNLVRDLRNGGELGPRREPVIAAFIENYVREQRALATKLEAMLK